MLNSPDIKYLNKDFSNFKNELIEYAKSYYPTVYNDFSQASPGSMFIEMASYVGDVLSFYLDNQLQETFLQYAKQKNNLYTMAYMLGYRPKVTSAAIADLDIYMQVGVVGPSGNKTPDWTNAITIQPGMQIKSNVSNNVGFYVPNKVDFTISSSLDPTDVSVYLTDGSGNPTKYLLKKKTQAISGQVKTTTATFGAAKRYATVNIQDSDIISVLKVVDSNSNIWYEVPYLAQDYILNPIENTALNYPSLYQSANQVPYMLQKVYVPRRFTTRFKTDNSLVLEFGPGINSVADSAVVPNPNSVGVGITTGLTLLETAFDPSNFVTTQTYGLAPQNTTLTISYLAGGGAEYNALSNQLTIPVSIDAGSGDTSTVVSNNPNPASGGGDGDTVEELRQNIQAEFSSQLRAVTQEDYLARTLSMSPKFGKVAKAYVTKDDATFSNYMEDNPSERDQVLVSMYVLGLDNNGNLAQPSSALVQNLQTYLSEYRMMTDAINIKPAYVINIGCNFDITVRPNFTGQDVVARCLIQLQDFFNVDNWQINEPIILSDIYTLLDQVNGVQTVKSVQIVNKFGSIDGYSEFSYDVPGAILNGVIYPSLDPSIFEVKYPKSDIQGRVVTM
jgi:hypothetical protein